MGSGSRRTAATVLLVGTLAVAASVEALGGSGTSVPAPGAPADCRPALRIEPGTPSQAKILARGRIRTTVLSCLPPGHVEIKAKSKIAGRSRRVTRRRELDLAVARARRVGLPLSTRGERRLARCVEQRLIFKAVARYDGRFVKTAAHASLRTDSPACAAGGEEPGPAPPTAPPPGVGPPTLELAPDGAARHVNGTPRRFELTGSAAAAAELALVGCGGFAPAEGEIYRDGASVEVNGADRCLTAVAFLDRDGDSELDRDPGGAPTEAYDAGGETAFEPLGDVELANADRCDFTDPARCLFPWPNDRFTVADPATDSGRRVALQSDSMPRNRAGVPIDPTDYNRNDGFSPGQLIVTKVPGLESQEAFAETGAVPITSMGAYDDPAQPVVVIDATTGERHPIWAEIDANPDDPAEVALLIRPSVNFEEGHRYIVALRNLRDEEGQILPAQRPFEIYRDRVISSEAAIESRRAHFESLFAALAGAGISRDELYLAWDFTVASERNLSERVLSIRDDAFAELGDTNLADLTVQGSAPTYAVTGVTNYAACGTDGCAEPDPITGQGGEDDEIARRVEGTFTVPCYLDAPACPPGSRFAFGADGLPQQSTVPHLAQFTCIVPRAAIDGADPPQARPSLYGHGLLGGAGEVEAGNVQAMAAEHNFVFCATDWAGFATQDLAIVGATLQDLSNFPRLVDRMQQGYLNFMFLGRLLVHPQGFAANPAFQAGGEPAIDTARLFYDGNSQGGIMGGGLTAVAPDFERAVLGVPGMNYSTLLRRSSDFAPYAEGNFNDPPGDTEAGLYDSYPDELERPLILSMVQMLWDRGEANGYAHHMTSDPLANTPAHQVLLHVAFGDHQVANVTAEVEARTIGASAHQPALDPGRIPGADPLWSIPAIPAYPFGGSALVYWDSGPPRSGDQGVVNPPTTNTPPDSPEFGRDPHGDPRGDPDARVQKSEFLRVGGQVVDVCDGGPCYAHGWTGP